MQLVRLAGRLAIFGLSGAICFSNVAMAQSDGSPKSGGEHPNPEMQADTHEGQNQGASAQYEMSGEDNQSSDDVDDGDPGQAASKAKLKEGTLQQERKQGEPSSP